MSRYSAVLLSCSSLILGSCSMATTDSTTPATATTSGASASTNAVTATPFSGVQNRVFVFTRCPVHAPSDQEVAPAIITAVAAAVLPKIVSAVTDAGASYLHKRGDELTASNTSRVSSRLYSDPIGSDPNPVLDLGCFAFVRGAFGPSPMSDVDTTWTAKVLKAVNLTTRPDLYFQARLLPSDDREAVIFRPDYLEYAKTAAKRSTKKSKDLLFTGYLEVLTKGDDGTYENKRFGDFQFAFTDVPFGTYMSRAQMAGMTSEWIPLPHPANIEPDKKAKAETAPATLSSSSSDSQSSSAGITSKGTKPSLYKVPFSLTMTAQETEDKGDLLLAATKVADDSKNDVADAITNYLKKRLGLANTSDTSAAPKTGGSTNSGGSQPKEKP